MWFWTAEIRSFHVAESAIPVVGRLLTLWKFINAPRRITPSTPTRHCERRAAGRFGYFHVKVPLVAWDGSLCGVLAVKLTGK